MCIDSCSRLLAFFVSTVISKVVCTAPRSGCNEKVVLQFACSGTESSICADLEAHKCTGLVPDSQHQSKSGLLQ